MKTSSVLLSIFALAAAAFLQGCVGYNSAIFATKTNVGLDLDTKPPTAEISIARRETVLEPSFEDGKAPPVSASFRLDSGFWIFANISSTFSGGDAAVIMASLYDADTMPYTHNAVVTNAFDSTLYLRKEPKGKVLFKEIKLEDDKIRPFIFGTDTSFGLKMAWSGMTAEVPDTVKLGFNRKEFALAPISGSTVSKTVNGENYTHSVKMPSFLATIDNRTQISTPTKTKTSTIQYFATGKAAERLSLQYGVRRAMAERSDPKAVAESDLNGPAAALVQTNTLNLQAVLNGVSDQGNPPKVDANKLLKAIKNVVADTNAFVTTWRSKPLDEFEKELRSPVYFGQPITIMQQNLK